MDHVFNARQQQDHDEGTFRRNARGRHRGVDPTEDSDDECISRAAAEVCNNAHHQLRAQSLWL